MPTSTEPADTSRSRVDLLDGLRGVAIVLVVLSHGWTLWPVGRILSDPFLEGIFTAGNFAVSIFFVASGFLVTRLMLGETDRTAKLRPALAMVRRVLRMSPVIYLLLLAVLLTSVLDVTDQTPRETTRDSALRVATFTWNWFLQNEPLNARPDLGHLWYLSVDMQVFCLLLVLVALLHRHRLVLAGLLLVVVLVVPFWQEHVLSTQGLFVTGLRTTTRMDAMLWGALAAVVLPFLDRFRGRLGQALTPSVLALVVLIFLTTDEDFFFGPTGLFLNLALVAFVLGAVSATHRSRTVRVLEFPLLLVLGRASLSIYVWHYPVFFAVARHSADWAWPVRTMVAFALAAAAAALCYLFVEVPLQRWLGSATFRERSGLIVRRPRSRAG